VIIFQRNVIRGITTAAGMWVASAIGMACGAGMYPIAVAATLLTLLCLDMVHFIHLRYGEKVVDLSLSSPENKDLLSVLDTLKKLGIDMDSYSISGGKLNLSLRLKLRNHLDKMKQLVEALEGFKIESMN